MNELIHSGAVCVGLTGPLTLGKCLSSPVLRWFLLPWHSGILVFSEVSEIVSIFFNTLPSLEAFDVPIHSCSYHTHFTEDANWSPEGLSNLTRVTQLISGKAKIKTYQAVLYRSVLSQLLYKAAFCNGSWHYYYYYYYHCHHHYYYHYY